MCLWLKNIHRNKCEHVFCFLNNLVIHNYTRQQLLTILQIKKKTIYLPKVQTAKYTNKQTNTGSWNQKCWDSFNSKFSMIHKIKLIIVQR